MDLVTLKALAYELMGNKSSHNWKEKGNKYNHGERVAVLALKLREIVLPDDDSHDDILRAAAWFHDIKNGKSEHARKGAEKTRKVLKDYCTAQELDEICGIIAVHDDRYHGRDTYSDYIKLHQDADLLDHFGTYDVWMHIAYVISHGQTLPESINWLINIRPTEDEKYRGELNFEISRMIYDEKSSYIKSFADRIKTEGAGGIWKEDEILSTYFNSGHEIPHL